LGKNYFLLYKGAQSYYNIFVLHLAKSKKGGNMIRRLVVIVISFCFIGVLAVGAFAAQQANPGDNSKGQGKGSQLQQEMQSLHQQAEELRAQIQKLQAQIEPLREKLRLVREKIRINREKLGAQGEERKEHRQEIRKQRQAQQPTLAQPAAGVSK